MYRRRFLGHGSTNFYHVMSRTTGGEFLFGDGEKFLFRRWLKKMAAFTGVRVVAWCCMSNHFHILVEVPDREPFVRPLLEDEERMLKHLGILYSKPEVTAVRRELELYRTAGHDSLADELLRKFSRRMCDLAAFMKELKQRLTLAFNRSHDRMGTLWMAPYKSVLVEGADALATVAAYIDLNPVRAGIVNDPKDYRFSSYAEAVAGVGASQRGLCRALGATRNEWRRLSGRYRLLLYGELDGSPGAVSRSEIEAVLESGGQLSAAQLLRCRVRYLSAGGILGSRAFLEAYLSNAAWQFGSSRSTASRAMAGGDWGSLFSIRDIKKNPICLPELPESAVS
ncbi:MAG: chemotaxis protein CheW [Verrucomicrobia bacterium]|nr:chemotaxis protein CheW [Verrucomicrobiota bacterium]